MPQAGLHGKKSGGERNALRSPPEAGFRYGSGPAGLSAGAGAAGSAVPITEFDI